MSRIFMNIVSIIGSGNVGRRVGEYFSKKNYVIFHDIDRHVIEELNKLGYNATTDMNYTLKSSDISFICIPTPLKDNGLYDLSFLKNVSEAIGIFLNKKNHYHIFILKSTVLPGTTRDIFITIIEKRSGKEEGKDFGIIYNPEFLTAISSTWTEDKKFCVGLDNEGRIVLGEGKNKKAGNITEEFYKEMNGDVPILRTNYETAEMTKLVANNRLALAISFSNEIFLACEELKKHKINIDVDFIIDAVSRDPRIGKYGSVFKKAFGGSCFPKDTIALNTFIKNKTGNFPRIIFHSIGVNNEMKKKYGVR